VSDPNLYQPSDLEEETIKDFIDSLYDELENISIHLLSLEREPDNRDVINALFRSIHSIKGNARMCFFLPISDFVHAVEEVISEVRSGRIAFGGLMGEAVSLALDHVKICAEELYRDGQADITIFDRVAPMFEHIKSHPNKGMEAQLINIVRTCGGQVVADVPLSAGSINSLNVASQPLPEADADSDLAFFAEMGKLIDETCPFWENRSRTQVKIALGINQYLTSPLDPKQLTAAVYLHDLGMSFLPGELINKTQKYNALEEKRLREHVQWSYQWVKRLPGWQEAATMILQHHERPDGKGYPNGLTLQELNEGGQVIALVDAFFAITNERSDRTYKKSLMRAITEINSYRDRQFKGSTVDAFNELMRELYTRSGE
jgi:two-component system response regulator RpfG